jgi:hypothetical protein
MFRFVVKLISHSLSFDGHLIVIQLYSQKNPNLRFIPAVPAVKNQNLFFEQKEFYVWGIDGSLGISWQ